MTGAGITATAAATAAAAAAAAATAVSSSMTAAGQQDGPGGDTGSGADEGGGNGECRLLGSFAILVQLALGGLAMLSLVFKRWRERPQRPLKIWFFDVSKQVFGSVLVHIANVFMSMLTSGRFSVQLEPGAVQRSLSARMLASRSEGEGQSDYVPNPCSFYLLNLAIDTTIGIPILIFLLRLVTALVAHTPAGKPPESIQSGHYGSPPRAWWWLKQSVIYFCGLFGMKLVVLIIFLMFPLISRVGDWALGWTEGNERLQIAFVMMLFPLIMNALQYYIIDSFIKQKTGPAGDGTEVHGPSTGPGGSEQANGLLRGSRRQRHPRGRRGEAYDELDTNASSDGDNDDEHDEYLHGSAKSTRKPRVGKAVEQEYDPATDGESQTVIGSGSSQQDRERLLSKDLIPPE